MNSLSQYALMTWLSWCFTDTQSLPWSHSGKCVLHLKEGHKHDQVCIGGLYCWVKEEEMGTKRRINMYSTSKENDLLGISHPKE